MRTRGRTLALIFHSYRDYSTKLSDLLADPVFQGDEVPKGQGEPVLLIPGFTAGDWTFKTMAPWLRRIGYSPHLSGINLNVGCPQDKVQRIQTRLEEISNDSESKVTIIGHSLGGVVARAIARNRPELVGHVVAIGSPLRSGWQAVRPEVRPALFAVHSFFQRFIEKPQDCGTELCSCAFANESFGMPLPASVRFTSIYSRQDGIVDWKCATTDNCESYEVEGLHTDLVVNAQVYRILGDVLGRLPERTRFSRSA